MAYSKLKILHLEDVPADAELVERELIKENILFEKEVVSTEKDFVNALTHFAPDVILADHSLPSFNSIEALKIVRKLNPTMPFILVTATISEEFAVEIMKEGADDYILKDRLPRLTHAILHAIEKKHIESERRQYYMELLTNDAKLKALNESLEKKVIERTAELEKANTELESFGYSISHDLKTPLTVINSSAEILEMKYGSDMGEDALKHLQKIKKQSRQMGWLIEDILLLSRLSRKVSFTTELVDMNQLAKSAIEELKYNYAAKIELGNLSPIEANTGLIKQVWLNLISNALKYSKTKKGPIIEIGSNPDNGYIVYYVKDNGAGFNMQKADRLFEAFQRLHTSEEFEGTGIGLAIVQRIVANHGGNVWAESEEGKGATFYFSLPATEIKLNQHTT
jgi:two-component system sensor histidine kinase/response regulator